MWVYLKITIVGSVISSGIVDIRISMQPFDISAQADFNKWADYKLSLYNNDHLKEALEPVAISADGCLTDEQRQAIHQKVDCYNFVLYRVSGDGEFDSGDLNRLGQSLGLRQLDANLCAEEDLISVITDTSSNPAGQNAKTRYIPYSNKALNWHTDGYYNPLNQRVMAFILHCKNQAESGGENILVDPDMIYLSLRRQNPDYITALSRSDVMRIPENRQDGVCIREETVSSVFQPSADFTRLAMRYSQRKRNINWSDDSLTQSALSELNRLLDTESNWRIKVRLRPGEGIISNNVLHCRQKFADGAGAKRLFLRARYYNAIPTQLN
jgi:alpha-ketoglutarate-dependent taurine dioxygenase